MFNKFINSLTFALLAVALLFLLVSCSAQYVVERNNWRTGLYVVDVQSVDSLRQMFRDAGHSVFDWNQYGEKKLKQLNAQCVKLWYKASKFVGDVDMNGGTNLDLGGNLTIAINSTLDAETNKDGF